MSEIHGAVGSYVVHALDPAELDEFEAHLAACPTCSREVVEFCETAAELSLVAPVTPPPPDPAQQHPGGDQGGPAAASRGAAGSGGRRAR